MCKNDVNHVLMLLLTILGMFQCLVLGCLDVYPLLHEKINMFVHLQRAHHIYSFFL
jgi:hypothetical protein